MHSLLPKDPLLRTYFTYFILATPSGNIGKIVGGTVGGVVAALAAVAVIGFILYRKRRYSGKRFEVQNYSLALSFLQPFFVYNNSVYCYSLEAKFVKSRGVKPDMHSTVCLVHEKHLFCK